MSLDKELVVIHCRGRSKGTEPDSEDEIVRIDHEQRRRDGLAIYAEIMGVNHPEPDSPRTAALIDFVYAEIWARPGLSRRARRLITLSCLAGADAFASLGDHIYGALASGDLTVEELDEW
ncbi:MAG: hypothetical protein JWM76_1421, partial [Pseudonocardiales bacterium]|nr:hypothetical protein [Pseudonocardiales bacterium]